MLCVAAVRGLCEETTRKENVVLQYRHSHSERTVFLAIGHRTTMSSKGNDKASPLAPLGLLGMSGKPSSVGQVAMDTGHGRWRSVRPGTTGQPTAERTLEERRGEKAGYGDGAPREGRVEEQSGAAARRRDVAGSSV